MQETRPRLGLSLTGVFVAERREDCPLLGAVLDDPVLELLNETGADDRVEEQNSTE